MKKDNQKKNWIEVFDKKEIKKIKWNDKRGILYLRIGLFNVVPVYVLIMIQSISVMIEYASVSSKIWYTFIIFWYTVILIGMVMLYRLFSKSDLVKKYQGTIWKTTGIVVNKGTNDKGYYEVSCEKFGESGRWVYTCNINRYDMEIGDTVNVVARKNKNSFEILTIYKNETYFEDRAEMLVQMNILILFGGIVFLVCPWASQFGIAALYFLIWKIVVWSVSIITNFAVGLYEKNKLAIVFSIVLLIGFLFFHGSEKTQEAFWDLVEGPERMEYVDVSFELEKTPAKRGDPYHYYAIIYKQEEIYEKVRIPASVYDYYTNVYRKKDEVIYYKHSGIVVK